eukprot:1100082-Pyramimonas_sp.AAC.2
MGVATTSVSATNVVSFSVSARDSVSASPDSTPLTGASGGAQPCWRMARILNSIVDSTMLCSARKRRDAFKDTLLTMLSTRLNRGARGENEARGGRSC